MFQKIANFLHPPVKDTEMAKKFLHETALFESRGSSNETVNVEALYAQAVTNGWVYSAIRLLADRLSNQKSLPMLGEETEDGFEPNELFDLFERSNGLLTWNFSLRYVWWWYFLRGNAYWFIETPSVGIGEPIALWPLIAGEVFPRSENLREGVGIFSGKPVIDYEYQVGGTINLLPGENIIHLRNPNYSDYWQGLSPLTAAQGAIASDNSQSDWQQTFFTDDNAIPSAIIALDKDMDTVDFETQIMLIKQQLDSGQKRLFTRSGDLKVEVLAQTFEQMQVTESRKTNQTEIYSIFGIPQGFFAPSSGDDAQAAEIMLARNTLQPHIDMLASQLTADLAPYYESQSSRLIFKSPDIIPQDRALAVQETTIYSQFRSLNETRKELGLPPVLDDVEPELAALADTPLKLLEFKSQQDRFERTFTRQVGSLIGNDTPGNMSQREATRSIEEKDLPPCETDDEEIDLKPLYQEVNQWRRKAIKTLDKHGNLDKLRFNFDHLPNSLGFSLLRMSKGCSTSDEIRDLVDLMYHRIADLDSNTLKAIDLSLDPDNSEAEWEEIDTVEQVNLRDTRQIFTRLFEELQTDPNIRWSDEALAIQDVTQFLTGNESLTEVLEQSLQRSAALGSDIAIRQLERVGISTTTGFSFRDPFALASEWARTDVGNLITQLDGTTQQTVRDVVSDYFAQESRGQARIEVANALREHIHGLSPQRAESIAITETTRAANAGHTLSYEQVPDLVRKRKWLTTRDEIVSRCFLKNTYVDGIRIDKVQLGDKVQTRKGKQTVVSPTVSDFTGGMRVLKVAGCFPLWCTEDHLIWDGLGWKQAVEFNIGDTVYGRNDQPMPITGIIDVEIGNPNYSIAQRIKNSIFFLISLPLLFSPMPVNTINLETDLKVR